MTNPTLDNSIENKEVILWQYDKAWNLIRLIEYWNLFAKASCQDFWDYFENNVFSIDRADEFGLNVWGNLLGIPRPSLSLLSPWSNLDAVYDRAYGPTTIHFKPSAIGMQSSDESIYSLTIRSSDTTGMPNVPIKVQILQSESEPALSTSVNSNEMVSLDTEYTFFFENPVHLTLDDIYVFRFINANTLASQSVAIRLKKTPTEIPEDLYFGSQDRKFVPVLSVKWKTYTPEGVPFSQTTVHLSDDFYRRILKARYFMMCHSPTVPNYNKFLTILFGARDKATNEIEYDESKIFDIEGNVKQNAYSSRSIALDFQDMSMGFSFPSDATDEEAQTIFQHYETLYPFPAGIRYPGEFIDDELVIGLNLTNGDSPTGQNYKNFVDGLVLAEDASSETANPNGGILSTTDRANYYTSPLVAGTAYICSVSSSTANVAIIATNTSTKEQKIWIDWGNGDCNYYYLPPSSTKTISPLQKQGYGFSGLVAIKVFYISEYISVAAPSVTGLVVVNTYDIGTSES